MFEVFLTNKLLTYCNKKSPQQAHNTLRVNALRNIGEKLGNFFALLWAKLRKKNEIVQG